MLPVAELLNQVQGHTRFSEAVYHQQKLVMHPDLTPSAQMLEEMHAHQEESFFAFARRKSEEHRAFFLQRELPAPLLAEFQQQALASLERQQQIESEDKMDLDSFLHAYFEGSL